MTKANPLNITHIDHVVIRVRNLERMVAFYRDVLGCKLERGPGDIGLAQLRAGRSLIDLIEASGRPGHEAGELPDPKAPNMDHVCFQVRPWDAQAIAEHLNTHGVEAGEVAQRYGAGGTGPSIYIGDPEGNRVELKGG